MVPSRLRGCQEMKPPLLTQETESRKDLVTGIDGYYIQHVCLMVEVLQQSLF